MIKNKTNLNKFLTGAVTATMVATAVVPVASAAGFTDIENIGTGVQAEINQAVNLGFFKEAPKFNPSTKITRGQAALTLARYIAGESTVKAYVEANNLESTVTAFNDVPVSYKNGADFQQELYYASLVVKNADAFTQSTLNPTGNVTRSQMAKIITQTFELEKVAGYVSNLTDIGQLDAGTKGFIETIASHGITNVTAFNPAGPVTRSQMASFLVRSYDAVHVEADLEITTVNTLEDIKVDAGEKVTLPSMVGVVYSDKTTADVKVNWNTTNVDFAVAGTYELTGTIAKTNLKATVKVIVEAVDPAVTAVKSINATQVEVKFNTAVDKATLFANGNSGAFKALASGKVVSLTSLDAVDQGTLAGVLSSDGKTLTVTAQNNLLKRYDIVIDGLKATSAGDISKYEKMITITADQTAPTILGTESLSATSVKVKFSEPMQAFNAVTFKYADGSAVTGVTGEVAANAEEVIFMMTDDTIVGKEIVATFIGAKDRAGNLLTPNPATVKFQKGAKDGVKPTISTITQTGAKTFAVKFSEELQSDPMVTYPGAGTTVAKDENDATIYNVTLAAGQFLEGAKTITVSNFVDLSGEIGTETSKVVNFVKDVVAPKVTTSSVVEDADGKEYLEVTFDKDVNLTPSDSKVSAKGTYVKNFVTSANFTLKGQPVTYKTIGNKRVVKVALKDLLTANDVKDAVYTLDLTFVKLTSDVGILAESKKVTFTRGTDSTPENTEVVEVVGFTQGEDNNKVNVTFNKEVDGATAINIANYQIAGAVVESVTLQPYDVKDSKTQIAVLNLKAGSNTFTGTRNINISGVKALGSTKVMQPYFINTVSLNENIAPTITSAKLTGTKEVTLTFSEVVTSAAVSTDFDLLIGGTVANTVTAEATTANKVVFTLKNPITTANIESGLALKAKSTLSIKDPAGNKLSLPNAITITE